MTTMKPYTVILRRPDYLADEWPDDVYLAYVEGVDTDAAIKAARNQVRKADANKAKNDDYALIAAFEGHPTIARHWFQDA